MSNTIVTILYANGDTREFEASHDLEQLIKDGEMFSVTTVHADDIEVEQDISRMYAGNPINALGKMIIMRDNAMLQQEAGTPHMDIVCEVLNECISMLTDEISSYGSQMTEAKRNLNG